VSSISDAGNYTNIYVVTTAERYFSGSAVQSWSLIREVVSLVSDSETLTSQLEVLTDTASCHTTLGLGLGAAWGTTTDFRAASYGVDADFTQNDVVVGDKLLVDGVGYWITSIKTPTVLTLDTAIPVNWAEKEFQIYSVDKIEYDQLISDLSGWSSVVAASDFSKNLSELERVMNPILAGGIPSRAQIGDVTAAATEVRNILAQLSTCLVAYEVRTVSRIDAVLKMLLERGLDRAYDALTDGRISDFYGMDKDASASSTFMLKTARTVVQTDLPVSKRTPSADDTVPDSSTIAVTDANYAPGDRDADENIRLLGNVPETDDLSGTSVRYRRQTY
jgi:hypothetical protein